MYKLGTNWIFSPSDLTTFWESEFAAWMERYVKEAPDCGIKADEPDGLQKVLQKKGFAHEKATITKLLGDGLKVVEIERSDSETALAATIAAMYQGCDVIFQAYLSKGQFAGYADFLVKIPGKSKLGDYHYEVWDTKLAGKLKPYFVIQLCSYSEMLEEIQGRQPNEIAVVLGNGQMKRLKVANYFYYYRAIVERFIEFHQSCDLKRMPSPERSRSYGKWKGHAEKMMLETDSLSQIAGISINQMKNLAKAGLPTKAKLAAAPDQDIPKMSREVFRNIRKQCQIQLASTGKSKPEFEVNKDCEIGKGLWLLPPSSKNDVYFDIEGFPVVEGGLEYLWGSAFVENGNLAFKDFWAHNSEQERLAFEAFVDWVHSRWTADQEMHVYHYANYETNVLKRLMGRYGSREEKVDDLLRNGVFVDLYQIVKQGLWIGAPSYSIKKVELIYRNKRSGDITDGGASVEYYQAWLDNEDGKTWENSKFLRDIRDYNKDDCDSTYELAQWLREIQAAAKIPAYIRKNDEENGDDEIDELKQASDDAIDALKVALGAAVATRPEGEILLQLLDFYRREDKPKWWRFFERMGMTEAQLRDDEDCLAGLSKSGGETPYKRSKLVSFNYDPAQETKMSVGDSCVMQHDPDGGAVEVFELDSVAGTVTLKVQAKRTIPDRINLIPKDNVNNQALRAGVVAVCQDWVNGAANAKAVSRFLIGEKPKIKGHTKGDLLADVANETNVADLIMRMDETTLCIQGPPGAGKTYLGKHVIAALLKAGKKVGIVSNSHKAVNNLMLQAAAQCREAAVELRAIKVRSEEEAEIQAAGNIMSCKSGSKVPYGDEPNLVGGTAWTFANENARGQFDYLFIDEAGQVSLANFVAMGLASKNVVLLGDQMQLSQPVQGTHPGRSGTSCLNFLLGNQSTIPSDTGIFLELTRRMHPDVCRYVSEIAYDGRLHSYEGCKNRIVKVPKDGVQSIAKEAGIIFVPVMHEGNSRASDEEVDIIVGLVKELIGRKFTDHSGNEIRSIGLSDILFIAPYNLQVKKLKEALGDEAKVGSIDKFQGQEAPIVILSMCSSSVSGGGGRGIDFLFSKNRLNVAVSRAQCLAIVVGNPDLVGTYCSNEAAMQNVSVFCQLVKFGGG